MPTVLYTPSSIQQTTTGDFPTIPHSLLHKRLLGAIGRREAFPRSDDGRQIGSSRQDRWEEVQCRVTVVSLFPNMEKLNRDQRVVHEDCAQRITSSYSIVTSQHQTHPI